jgi:DNA adenine methylase
VADRLPHPIPYQGSKRLLAARILGALGPRRFGTLHEPFAGSAAITLAAAARGLARRFVLGDSLASLVALWERIVAEPAVTAERYQAVWEAQTVEGAAAHYMRVRAEFNVDRDPVKLLYLLARCVKNAPRFGRAGAFNQSADHRRCGMRPERMRAQIAGASALLAGRVATFVGDAEACIARAGRDDLVYLDPPWQGTTEGADARYHRGFARARLEALLADLNARGVPWLLSYDGRSGARTYGPPLAPELIGVRIELAAGRSAQSTLSGRAEETVESLYLAPALMSGEPHASPRAGPARRRAAPARASPSPVAPALPP